MSSVLKRTKDATSLRRQFMIHPYSFYSNTYCYFTVQGESLYRVENDLTNLDWVIARDMGSSRRITTIDPEIIQLWESNNGWTDVEVIRPGEARKFQILSMVRGNFSVSNNNGPAWNSGTYLDSEDRDIYNYEGVNIGINEPLIIGHATTTVLDTTYQNLPYGTFWAINDPIVIRYVYSDVTYTRAIKNRIDETTFFG